MLPKKHRLPLRSLPDFFSSAQKQHTPFFSLFYAKTASLSQAAVIVPKKTFLKATQRNKVKRAMQDALAPFLTQEPGLQLVVFVKPAAANLGSDDLLTELKKAYDSINKNVPSA